MLKYIILLTVAVILADAVDIKFKLRGKDLPKGGEGIFSFDAYVKATLHEKNGSKVKDLGKTNVITDNRNPNWSTTFTVTYLPGRYIELELWDKDPAKDRKVEVVKLQLDMYLNKKEELAVKLKKGQIIAKKA